MPDGWLLDITESRDGKSVVLWVKDGTTGRVRPTSVPYRPPFLVAAAQGDRTELRTKLREIPGIAEIDERTERPDLFDRRPRRVFAVTAERNFGRRKVATAIDALGEYRRFTLYDVDLTPPQLYHLDHGLYPFAPVVGHDAELQATEPAETIDYESPPLRTAVLAVTLAGHSRRGVAPADGRIGSVQLGRTVIEGEEEEVLVELLRELGRSDPDLLLTEGGDGFDLPWLYRRAIACGFPDSAFVLGREPAAFRPTRKARSYESYGRIEHREATFPLPGRFHIDRENSFLFDDTEVEGLIDAARLSRLSLQTVVRQSPGTCFTAMEMAHALSDGVHIPWKKNRPEEFKSGAKLVEADRGGVIFLPPVGVFDRVDEFDFASLYPHIMVRRNLSTETLDCRCCPDSPIVAPGLGYRSCLRRIGLIPRTLEPLLARRLSYKTRLRRPNCPPSEKERLKRRVKMLKWILVTAFGYQGYRNARFGRIECHEAINAYARELIARLIPEAEAYGYRVLHGLVDSLWLTPVPHERRVEPERFAEKMSRKFDLPLGYEGRYRWVVFLPAVTGLGVPNRYYGRYEHGEFKLRGIGARRHDTTGFVRRFELEILKLFAEARNADEVRRALPKAVARADLFADGLKERRFPSEELQITHRLGKDPTEFVTFTDTLAALRQLAEAGANRMPGEYVRYVILDRTSRSWRTRVRVAEALTGEERYDVGAYLELLARAAETLLAPLGVDRATLLERWHVGPPPERERYHSAEQRAQRSLGAGEASHPKRLGGTSA